VIARRTGVVGIGLLIALAAVAVVLVATLGRASAQTETGLVVSVDASSLTDVRGFSIRTSDGRTVVFRIGVLENGAAFPPGHLLEHQATGVKVVVTYREDNGELVAIRLEDARGSGAGRSPSAPASHT
jgi:hypothetical protein